MKEVYFDKISMKGLREFNEDTDCAFINIGDNRTRINSKYSQINLFIVCDGHGGDDVSKFIIGNLKKKLLNPKIKYPLTSTYIEKIFNSVNDKIKNNKNDIGFNCGSTTLIVIMYLENNSKENLQIINLGDCRAVLSRDGLPIPLSIDHKPHWPNERERIEKIIKDGKFKEKIILDDMGEWRICGLSVSRSFGDYDCLPYVTHIPQSQKMRLEKNDKFIVVACDGLWDVLQNHQVVNFITDHIKNIHTCNYDERATPYNLQYENDGQENIAKKLANYALSKGSTDNVTIIIVYLT